jgi:FtsP/CotA-like multicopper oxidase with cupredoxin domain
LFVFSLLSSGATIVAAHAPPLPPIEANDNRRAAGTIDGEVLKVRLEARTGTWYPEGPRNLGLEVGAWAEEGKPLQNPGPLIRARVGMQIRATLRNSLGRPLTVYGFGAMRGRADSLRLEAGQVREVAFRASAPGTYYYMARSGAGPFGSRLPEDSQLHGAIVIDPATAPPGMDERVFVLSWWFTLDSTSKTGIGRATMAINGLSWPHTERVEMLQGDSTRWRVLNMSESAHPMHLHGFYFLMESKGNGATDSLYASDEKRLAVTEIVNPFRTISFVWAPTRSGNWIYHCHFVGHLSNVASLDTYRGESAGAHDGHGDGQQNHMFGLVLGIRVAPRGPKAQSTIAARPMRLIIREKANVYGDRPGYAYVLDGTDAAKDPSAMPLPGPTLVLEKNQPVAITIVNTSRDQAAVHWHGIELESFPDGVPGWSGKGKHILPAVAPGDSITVRFTPPRAGTFMYHSHFNEDHQINSGLHGAIVVLDPGQRFDPETDRVLLFSSAGPTTNVIRGPFAPTQLNGQVQPGRIELRAGTTYRLRLVNITGDVNTVVSLQDGDTTVAWRAIAKDGATLPPAQRVTRPASLFFDPGEIYDFEFTPANAGSLTLRFGPPPSPNPAMPRPVTVPVVVR